MDDDHEDVMLEDDELHERDGPDWNWWLVTIPIVALATLVLVLLYGANTLEPTDLGDEVELFHIVIAGSLVLLALLIVELVLLLGKHPDNLEDEAEPAPAPDLPAAREDEAPDLEAVSTDDNVEGRQVLEVARPPKWAVDAGVYATTYVPVDTAHVLRLEEIVALRP